MNVAFVAPFTGGSRVIQRGLATPGQILLVAVLATIGGAAVGMYLVAYRGPVVLLLGIVGVLSCFFYTAPPLAFGYRGFGEVVVATDLGLLVMMGTELVLTGRVSPQTAIVSLTISAFVTNALLINEFPDAEADAVVGKRHLVVRLGRRRAVAVVVGLYLLAVALLALCVSLMWLPAQALWSCLAVIPAGLACQALADGPDDRAAWVTACPAGIAAHLVFGVSLLAALMLSSPRLAP